MTAPSEIFVSYSHADAKWLKRLRVHLTPLERDGSISLWDDTRIRPGSKWREEIREALDRATAAILLVSADFLASPFIRDNELPPLLSAAETRGTLILPVIVSPCRFQETTSLARFQAVNSPTEPLRSMPPSKREEIFVRISNLVEQAFPFSRAQSRDDIGAQERVVTEQHKHGALTATPREPLTREGIAQWSDEDVMRYIADQLAVHSRSLAPGVVISLKDLFHSTDNSAVKNQVYALVHGCIRNGWVNWSGADQDRQVRLTVAGTHKARELISNAPAQLAETPTLNPRSTQPPGF
jgi:TIR domain